MPDVELKVIATLKEYDRDTAQARHREILSRLDGTDEIVNALKADLKADQNQFLGGQKVLMYVLAAPSLIASILSIIRYFRAH